MGRPTRGVRFRPSARPVRMGPVRMGPVRMGPVRMAQSGQGQDGVPRPPGPAQAPPRRPWPRARRVLAAPRARVPGGGAPHGGPAEAPDDEAVPQRQRVRHRPDEVDEQHRAQLVGVVPHLVVERVVEDERLALLPVPHRGAHLDAAALLVCGHDEAEVVAQHARVRPAVLGDVLARAEDREHRRLHPRDRLEQRGRPRAAGAVLLAAVAVDVEDVGLPAVVRGEPALVRRHGLEAGNGAGPLQQHLELGADLLPVARELGRPRELPGVEELAAVDALDQGLGRSNEERGRELLSPPIEPCRHFADDSHRRLRDVESRDLRCLERPSGCIVSNFDPATPAQQPGRPVDAMTRYAATLGRQAAPRGSRRRGLGGRRPGRPRAAAGP